MSEATSGCLHYPFGAQRPSVADEAGAQGAPPAQAVVSAHGAPLAATSKRRIDPATLERPVSALRGVGRATDRRLRGLGIRTIADLLWHLPFRHELPSRLVEVGALGLGVEVTLRGRVLSCACRQTARRRVSILEALVSDDTGSVLALWYNQAYLEAAFRERPEVLLKGMLVRQRGAPVFVVKRHEILGDAEESRHILGLVPVYPSTADLSVRTIRTLLHEAAPLAIDLPDPLPAEMLARRRYAGRAEAILASHFPVDLEEAGKARERLAFEELLLLQLAVLEQRHAQDARERARALAPPGPLSTGYLADLPFKPTGAQTRVIAELEHDLQRPVPMRRLLHGDVGSGKTMVAAYCLLRAVEQGGQGALMAPTEVLADQHYLGLVAQLAPHGVRVRLLKGSQAAGERRAVRKGLEAGDIDIVVGTHALIQQGVRFRDLRLAVVDEQHRFGVAQRDAIVAGSGKGVRPHTLHMSATPIPRTLSLTLYGDLDVSVLDEMPPGRRPVATRLVAADATGRMWDFVRGQIRGGRQAYVVCPLIEESEALEAASALQMFAELAAGELAGFRLRLLHGQLPAAEKAAAMAEYAVGKADVLVSTSVIEVGVDIANATVMVILGARRFGLSQLHQLRGRVGRGAAESYCFLPIGEEDEPAMERLRLFASTSDGFALAEADLLTRGTGQLFGERQSGLGDLRVASLLRDRALLEEARSEAAEVLKSWTALGGSAPAPAGGSRSAPAPPLCAPEGVSLSVLLRAADERFGLKMPWLERV
jgi:ATP-dependent DNA helicase RecG